MSDYFFGESTAEVQTQHKVLGVNFKIGDSFEKDVSSQLIIENSEVPASHNIEMYE